MAPGIRSTVFPVGRKYREGEKQIYMEKVKRTIKAKEKIKKEKEVRSSNSPSG